MSLRRFPAYAFVTLILASVAAPAAEEVTIDTSEVRGFVEVHHGRRKRELLSLGAIIKVVFIDRNDDHLHRRYDLDDRFRGTVIVHKDYHPSGAEIPGLVVIDDDDQDDDRVEEILRKAARVPPSSTRIIAPD